MSSTNKSISTMNKTINRHLSFALAATFCLSACAPKTDVNDPDQAPDVNYNLTELKDSKMVGSIPQVDVEVTSRMPGKFPGVAIGISDGGKVVYLKGYGVADFKVKANPFDDVPFTKDTVYTIGSVSKVLTAIAVMRLAELGEINLDNPMTDYFPHAMPANCSLVTVRNLLSHRAGLVKDPDSAQNNYMSAAQVDATFGETHACQHPRYAIWQFLLTNNAQPVQNNIGDYFYSNIGYTYLGAIVDFVTKKQGFNGGLDGYERFVWDLVANASDSALTACLDHPWRSSDIPNLVQGYSSNWNELNTNYSGWQSAAGGWSVTIGDMTRIFIALAKNQILTGASLADMRTNPGIGGNYGLGLNLASKNGKPAFSHGGYIDGARTQCIYWPTDDIGVCVFGNADRTGTDAIATAVATAYLAWKTSLQQMVFSRADRMTMQTATYELSNNHFAAAERTVHGLLGRYGDELTHVFLVKSIRTQSTLGNRLTRSLARGTSNLEVASNWFLSMLSAQGRVGPYVARR